MSADLTISLSNPASCECGGSGFEEGIVLQGCDVEGTVTICEGPYEMTVEWEIRCPDNSAPCSATAGGHDPSKWLFIWTLVSTDSECPDAGDTEESYFVDCDEDSIKICWGPVGGIPAHVCCGGGTGNGTWNICLENS